jgi:hypothetical protein
MQSATRDLSASLLVVQSEVAALHTPVSELRNILPTVQKTIGSVQESLDAELGTLGNNISEDNRIIREELHIGKESVVSQLVLQQAQLDRIEGHLALQNQLDSTNRPFKRLPLGQGSNPQVRDMKLPHTRKLTCNPGRLWNNDESPNRKTDEPERGMR